MKRLLIVVVAVLLILIPVWIFGVASDVSDLTDKDLIFSTTLKSTDWFWDEDTRDFSYVVHSNSLWKTTLSKEGGENNPTIVSLFRVETPSGDLVFESEREYVIDRKTGVATDVESQESAQLFFPMGVEKEESYFYWSNDANVPIEIKFKGTETVKGLKTYIFSGGITIDLTEGYSFEEGVPEEKRVISEQDNFEMWIEPVTGIIIKYDSSGSNKYYDSSGETFLEPRNNWQNVFDEKTIFNRVSQAKNEKWKVILFKIIIPVLFGLIALALLVISFVRRKNSISSSNGKEQVSKKQTL